MTTSRERIIAAWEGRPGDYTPLTTWCFGLRPPERLRWERDGQPREYWYSLRMEHIHTLPQPWDLEDDFRRVLAWQSLGIDDILDVSVPWSVSPGVSWEDTVETRLPKSDRLRKSGESSDGARKVLVRTYQTPAGPLVHRVRKTGEAEQPGWVVQPNCVPLFEDYNIPRAVKHAVAGPPDVPAIRHLYAAPDAAARRWFVERMAQVKRFADLHGVAVQAWSAFGMDGLVWLAGAEGTVMLALDHPQAFGELMEIVTETDLARTELAASTPGVDMIVARGWYSSTDFWSPALFDRYVYPYVERLARLAHGQGKKLAYVMTTGVEILGPRLADAGADVLYFVDPVQDRLSLARVREILGRRMTVAGGTNALSLASGDPQRIRQEVRQALDILGSSHRFILHPVDGLFPDTPWEGVEQLIAAWRAYR